MNSVQNSSGERKDSIDTECEAGAVAIGPIEQNNYKSMAWNWNSRASNKIGCDIKKPTNTENNYLQHLSYDCYDQTLDRLMGEFNMNKGRKRNWGRNVDQQPQQSDNNYNSSVSSTETVCGAESKPPSTWTNQNRESSNVEDVNFWTKVFFNNNESTTKKVQPDTAIIFNSIISNLNDQRTKSHGTASNMDSLSQSIRDMDVTRNADNESNALTSPRIVTDNDPMVAAIGSSSYNLLNKNLPPKRKNVTSTAHRQGESDNFRESNDASSIAQTTKSFLQTLNDLRLDYNDLSSEQNSTRIRSKNGNSKTKDG